MATLPAPPAELAGRFGAYGDFVIPWYGVELNRLEALEPRGDTERFSVVERVDDMSVSLDDLIDEGEPHLEQAYVDHFDARTRLDALRVAHARPGDTERLTVPPRADRLVPEPFRVEGATGGAFGDPQPYGPYLEHLVSVTFDDAAIAGAPDVVSADEWAPWRAGTHLVLADQVAFAQWALARGARGAVTLLRDALPYYLTALRRGVPTAAVPLGRHYGWRFGSDYAVYDQVAYSLYGAARRFPDDPAAMWGAALSELRRRIDEVDALRMLRDRAHAEMGPLLPDGELIVLETGLQGTMPLLFAALFEQTTDWAMYAAGPQLADAFDGHTFRRYAALRSAETLTCTDRLFRVEYTDDRWLVRETLDPATRACGLYEIALLNAGLVG